MVAGYTYVSIHVSVINASTAINGVGGVAWLWGAAQSLRTGFKWKKCCSESLTIECRMRAEGTKRSKKDSFLPFARG
jgi:hypothetical protein